MRLPQPAAGGSQEDCAVRICTAMQRGAWAALPSESHLWASPGSFSSSAELPAQLCPGPRRWCGARVEAASQGRAVRAWPVLATTLHFHTQSDLWDLRWVRLARLPASRFWLLSTVDRLVAPVLPGALGGYWQDHREGVLLSWPTVCWVLVVCKTGPQSSPSSRCTYRKGPLG